MRKCTVYHGDQNFGGCGIKGARTCCKDCIAITCCASVCSKAYEVDACVHEDTVQAGNAKIGGDCSLRITSNAAHIKIDELRE